MLMITNFGRLNCFNPFPPINCVLCVWLTLSLPLVMWCVYTFNPFPPTGYVMLCGFKFNPFLPTGYVVWCGFKFNHFLPTGYVVWCGFKFNPFPLTGHTGDAGPDRKGISQIKGASSDSVELVDSDLSKQQTVPAEGPGVGKAAPEGGAGKAAPDGGGDIMEGTGLCRPWLLVKLPIIAGASRALLWCTAAW